MTKYRKNNNSKVFRNFCALSDISALCFHSNRYLSLESYHRYLPIECTISDGAGGGICRTKIFLAPQFLPPPRFE